MKKIMNLFKASILLLTILLSACNNGQAGNKENQNLSASEFQKQIKAAASSNIIDVRTPEEYVGGHIEHSQNINWNGDHFEAEIEKLDKNTPAFVYCLGGGRSASAASFMREHGFKKVYELQGGMMSWRSKNLAEVIDLTTEKKPGMSKADFEKQLSVSNKVLVDVYAEWCVPCKKMKPSLDAISAERTDVKLLSINADDNMNLCKELGIESLPVLIYFEKGKQVWRKDGYQTKEDILKDIK
jgi:thioredoxin